MKFSSDVVESSESLVAAIAANPVVLRNETKEEAKIPAGHVGLIANYRGHKDSGKGRRARGAGEAVLDLSAFAVLPAKELTAAIAYLKDLNSSLQAGITKAEEMEG